VNGTRILGIETATRAQRRRLVTLMYVSYVLTFVAMYLRNNPALLVAAPVCVFVYAVIVKFTRNYSLRSSPYEAPRPDEREARVREYAMARSYVIIAVVLAVSTAFVAAVADEQTWWRLHHRIFSTVGFAVNFLVLSLPEAIIAWSEPDLPKAEPLT